MREKTKKMGRTRTPGKKKAKKRISTRKKNLHTAALLWHKSGTNQLQFPNLDCSPTTSNRDKQNQKKRQQESAELAWFGGERRDLNTREMISTAQQQVTGHRFQMPFIASNGGENSRKYDRRNQLMNDW